MRVRSPVLPARASSTRWAMATPDCRWTPKSRSRIKFSTWPSRAMRMASSGVDAVTSSANGQRSTIHALIWAMASGESSAIRMRRATSSGRGSGVAIALVLPPGPVFPRRAAAIAAGCGVRQLDDHLGSALGARPVLDLGADLLGPAAHEGHAGALGERPPTRRAIVADADLDAVRRRHAQGHADEGAPGVLAGISDRLEHDSIEQHEVGGSPGTRLDGRVGDLRRA